jgi:hypothetical protein
VDWFSPEVFVAVFGTGGIIVSILQHKGVTNFPRRRAWSKRERETHMEQRLDCTNAFKDAFARIKDLEAGKTENQTLIAVHKEALIAIDASLAIIIKQNAKAAGVMEFLEKTERKRNGDED